MSFRRLKAVTKKELLHIVRDIRSLYLALALPLVMLLLFGFALTLDVDRIQTYVYDQDRTPQSRELIDQFQSSRYFEILRNVTDYKTIELGIDRNTILLSIVIPKDYARHLLAGEQADVQLLIDGSDSNTAGIAAGYADAIIQTYASRMRSSSLGRRSGQALGIPVDPRIRVWYNSDLKSKNFIVPGLIAVTMMIIASMLSSLTIAREWENGTMEQLLSTPVRPRELVLGKLLAYFVLGLTDIFICVVVGVFIFQVPFRGNVLFLLLSCCLFLFGALAWGIFVSAGARTQLQAYQMGMLSSFLPGYILSGFVYAIREMPKVIQLISYAVPARYFVTILNGVFLKGVGLQVLWLEVSMLAGYAGLVFVLATRKMRLKVA
ncbi:MAG TPA: ABC transporter permease [Bryobacteraceae bacterium]|nr:ABC transporter permease [Bryobacteraceae bacterium]